MTYSTTTVKVMEQLKEYFDDEGNVTGLTNDVISQVINDIQNPKKERKPRTKVPKKCGVEFDIPYTHTRITQENIENGWSGYFLQCYVRGKQHRENGKIWRTDDLQEAIKKAEDCGRPAVVETAKGFEVRDGNLIWKNPRDWWRQGLSCYVRGEYALRDDEFGELSKVYPKTKYTPDYDGHGLDANALDLKDEEPEETPQKTIVVEKVPKTETKKVPKTKKIKIIKSQKLLATIYAEKNLKKWRTVWQGNEDKLTEERRGWGIQFYVKKYYENHPAKNESQVKAQLEHLSSIGIKE